MLRDGEERSLRVPASASQACRVLAWWPLDPSWWRRWSPRCACGEGSGQFDDLRQELSRRARRRGADRRPVGL